MDPWQSLPSRHLLVFFGVSAVQATWGLRQRSLERKLDLILKHLGLGTELSVEIPRECTSWLTWREVQAIRELRQSNHG